MKILHVCETAKGGISTYINTLADAIGAEHANLVILPDTHESSLADRVRRATFCYRKRSVRSLISLLFISILAWFNFKPNIVFCHSTFSLLPLVVLRLVSRRTKFIYCAHGWAGARNIEGGASQWIVRLIEGTLCRFAHRVINISNGEFDYARQHGYLGRHTIIKNAVVPACEGAERVEFSGDAESLHLLFVGRLDYQKGVDILLAAFALARQINPRLKLHIIGEAVLSGQPAIGQTGARDAGDVEFLGWVPFNRIDAYFAAADLVVVPSRWEGFGLVIPEALRNGTPVLVSERSDMPSLIEPGVSGFASPLEIAQFAMALTGMEKRTLQSMRPACLSPFNQRYHADRLGREVNALYTELLAT